MRRLKSLSLILVFALFSNMTIKGFHVPPWDTGHNSFQGNPGDTTDPGNDSCNSNGSPFEIATGNLIYSAQDFFIPGVGPSISIIRTYNSHDLGNGMFGRGWSFAYENRLVETTDGTQQFAICREGDGKRLRFNKNVDGTYTSPPDNFAVLTRDASQRFQVREKDGLDRKFDADGRLISVSDRNGNTLTLSYDSAGFLTTMTDARGRNLVLTKGVDGKVESVRDPAGRVTSYTYDANGRLISTTDPTGARTQYQYDANHNLTRIIDPRGNTVQQLSYDSIGRVTSYIEDGSTWTVSYNPSAKRTTKRDSRGNNWIFTYNDNKNIVGMTDPLGRTESVVYDANFNVTSVKDRKANETKFKYDSAGNVIEITNAKGQVTQNTYSATLNLITSVTDASGNITRFEYDDRGNLTKVTDATNNVTKMTYDSSGLLIVVEDPVGNFTRFKYDNFGRLSEAQDALGNKILMTRDVLGNITSVTDALGRQTQYTFDAANRLTQVVDPLGGTTRFSSDANGNLSSITNPSGQRTSFEYDGFNRLIKVTNPLIQNKTYGYGGNGNLTTATDASGLTTTYTYDGLDRLITKTTTANTIRYTYDPVGNLLSVTDNDTAVTFTYDELNNVTQTTASGPHPTATLRFTYDVNGNRKTMIDSLGRTTDYTYDSLLRLTGLNARGAAISFSYDGFSRRTSLTYPNGTATAFSYDGANRMNNIDVLSGGTPIGRFNYTNDPVGNRLSETELQSSHSYTYDSLNRLLAVAHTQSNNPNENFSYDASDNRVVSHLSTSYQHDAANRLLEDATYTYTYSASGLLLRKKEKATDQETTFSYDSEGQLISINFPDGGVATYKYDGLGRRVEKNARGQITRYVYDSDDIVLEYDGANALKATYTHGSGVDEPLMMERNGQNFFYHQDSVGSIRFLTDAAGSVAKTFAYDSYGRVMDQTGALVNPYSYTGREFDAESGFYYYRARYYDPAIGRFIQEDPIGFDGGLNFYTYVANNPVNYVDPQGKFIHLVIGAGASVATGFIISKLTGSCYSWKDALFDAGTGAVGAGLLSKLNKLNRIRQLRNVAKSRGLTNMGKKGYTETWQNASNNIERLNIKFEGAKNAGLQPGSYRPRFDYRIGPGTFWDPFTGATGPKGALSHIPLEPLLPPGASAGAGAVTGGAAGAARGGKDCGCK